MMVYTLTLGLYRVHCYILEEEGQVVLIDPGARVDLIEARLRALGSPQVLAIILTMAMWITHQPPQTWQIPMAVRSMPIL